MRSFNEKSSEEASLTTENQENIAPTENFEKITKNCNFPQKICIFSSILFHWRRSNQTDHCKPEPSRSNSSHRIQQQ